MIDMSRKPFLVYDVSTIFVACVALYADVAEVRHAVST